MKFYSFIHCQFLLHLLNQKYLLYNFTYGNPYKITIVNPLKIRSTAMTTSAVIPFSVRSERNLDFLLLAAIFIGGVHMRNIIDPLNAVRHEAIHIVSFTSLNLIPVSAVTVFIA